MAVRVLNSDSGHLIRGAENEKSDRRHIEMTFSAWSIFRSSFFRRYAATSIAPSMTFHLCTVESTHIFWWIPSSLVVDLPGTVFS